MIDMTRTGAAMVAALLLFTPAALAPALADNDGGLIGDIVSSEPEPSEDCDALRDRLEAQRDDGILNTADRRELTDRGC